LEEVRNLGEEGIVGGGFKGFGGSPNSLKEERKGRSLIRL